MINKDDCIALCGLEPDEVAALAEHEHISDIAAAALADYLLHHDHGVEVIRDMIVHDMRRAVARGDSAHAAELLTALRHFVSEHGLDADLRAA
jgi:hypothetical protein